MTAREHWYRQLASADLLIVEARERVEGQKTHISDLQREGQSTGKAVALLRLFEETLHVMNEYRSTILDIVRRYRLPVYQERGAIILLKAKDDVPRRGRAVNVL